VLFLNSQSRNHIRHNPSNAHVTPLSEENSIAGIKIVRSVSMLPGRKSSPIPLLRLNAYRRRITQLATTRTPTLLVGRTRSIAFSTPHSASPSSSIIPNSSAIPLSSPPQTNRPANLKAKKEGDISSVFASLSNESSKPLPSHFVDLKQSIVGAEGSENLERVYESWKDLLGDLSREVEEIKERGNKVRPY
jgi:hypothetical protein